MMETRMPAGQGGHDCITYPNRTPQEDIGQVIGDLSPFLADAVHRAFEAGRCFEARRLVDLAAADAETLVLYSALMARLSAAA